MTQTSGAVEIELPSRDRVRRVPHLDELALAVLNDAIDDSRRDIAGMPNDWAAYDLLACQLVSLSAGRMLQQRGYDAQELLAEAEVAVARAIDILRNLPTLESDRIIARFMTLRAVVQYNAAVLFYETGNDSPGAQYLGYANQTLSSVTPNPYCEGLHESLTAAIDSFDLVD